VYDACICEHTATVMSMKFMLAFALSSLPESYGLNCNHDLMWQPNRGHNESCVKHNKLFLLKNV